MSRSNDADVPGDEIFLAKLIQNAEYHGLKSCSFNKYSNHYGTATDKRHAVACCAVGAAGLEIDTELERMNFHGLVDGNDLKHWLRYGKAEGEEAGWAFREALRDESE